VPRTFAELFKLSTPSPSKLAAMVVFPGARLVHRTWKEATEPGITTQPSVSTDVALDEQDT
jgi:hypothetical protein